jgi:hypothetical protein
MRAIEAAGDALFRETRVPGMRGESEIELEAAQRRADAIGLLAERALAAGFGNAARGCGRGDVSAETSEGVDAPISGTRAERNQVVLHVEPATLAADCEPGRSEMEDGTRVSAETSRRLSCDAGLVTVQHGEDGSVLNVGRKSRTIPPAVRRALEARDRGCRFPGCGRRFTDAHHVKHWADGGETSLRNSVLLCRFHHRLVHEGGWRIEWWGTGKPMFYNMRGEARFDGSWQPPKLSERSVDELIDEQEARGVKPDGGPRARDGSERWISRTTCASGRTKRSSA